MLGSLALSLQAFYNSEFDDEPEVIPRMQKAAALLSRFAMRPRKFLDIGCGRGSATIYMAQLLQAATVAGVDISDRAVIEARRRNIDAHVVDLDHANLPFADESIDAIHCGEVIEHVVDTDHLLEEIRRVLTPQGVCVLSTPNLAAWFNRLVLFLGYQPFYSNVSFRYAPGRPRVAPADGGGHLRMFTHRALIEMLNIYGFEILATRGAGIFELGEPQGSGLVKRLVAPIDKMFTRMPSLACDLIVAFRRNANLQKAAL